MVSLNEKRLTAIGINQAVNEIQEAAQRNAHKAGKSVEILVSERLDAEKDLLKRIYFLNMNEEQIQGEIQSARFAEFPQLQYVLSRIFAQEKHPGVITIPEDLPDWKPPHTYTKKSFTELTSKYRYFDNISEAMEAFFETLQPLCRKMTQLVERQADDEEMAYKLMVLFPQRYVFSDHNECLNTISGQFKGISKPVQAQKPYHRVFVTELGNFPSFETQEKINAWRDFIVKEKFDALPFFADCQSFTSVPKNLKEAKQVQLAKTYPRAAENIKFAKLCKSYLIDNDGFESGLEFIRAGWPKKIVENLPAVDDITHNVEGYEYRWVKLDQNDERALYLGKMTGCCQFINGHARQCVIDGISLSDNGFYVLLKKKIKTQELFQKDEASDLRNYEIVAQSYAWISKNGNLCLDSLEWNRDRVSEEILKMLMSKFANQVIQKYPQVKYVNVGAGGQTPRNFYGDALLSEKQRQGTPYGDSESQYCIQSRLTQDVTEKLNATTEFNQLNETLRNKILYLSAYLVTNDLRPEKITCMSRLLESSFFQPFPPINQGLTELDFRPLTIEQYLGLPEHERQGISTFCKLLNCDSLDTLVKWLSEIPSQERINILISRDNFGKTVLHTAAGNSEYLKTILQLLGPEEALDAVQKKDSSGNTVLHLVATNPNSLKMVLEQTRKEDRLAALQTKDSSGNTVLHLVATNPDSMKIILDHVTAEEYLAAVRVKDRYEQTLLHLATSNPDTLKMILDKIPAEQCLAAVQDKDIYEQTALKLAITNPDSLKMILQSLSPKDLLAAVQDKDRDEKTLLHLATSNPDSLKMILQSLSPKDRLAAVQDKDRDEKTLLHRTATNPDFLEIILKLIPEKDRIDAVQTQDGEGKTVLNAAANNPKSFKAILAIYPSEARLEAIKAIDGNKRSIVLCLADLAASSPDHLKIILDLIPKDARLAEVQTIDGFESTVLNRLACSPEYLKNILNLIAEEDRLAALQTKDSSGKTVLHRAASNPNSMKIIFALLAEQDRLEALQTKDVEGKTVLNSAADNPWSFKVILKICPPEQRLEAVKSVDEKGKTALHYAVYKPKYLGKILALLPEQDRFEAVKVTDNEGKTVLHAAADEWTNDTLKAILEIYPPEHRLEAVKAKDNEGKTVLPSAARALWYHPDRLEVILKCLSPEDRLEAVRATDSEVKTVDDIFKKYQGSFLTTLDYGTKNDSSSHLLAFSMFNSPKDPEKGTIPSSATKKLGE